MFAMEGERIACGSAHADNVAPAIFGGFTLIRSSHPLDTLDVISINTPKDLYCSIIHPNIKINTWVARGILNPMIKLTDAVTQWGNVAGLIAGLMSDDYALIARSLTDVIVEPLRAKLIPGFYDIKNAALEAGALGVGISGSGPAIFALSNSQVVATKVVAKMQESAATAQLLSETYVSKINSNGVKVID
jgi:homoserine kinase